MIPLMIAQSRTRNDRTGIFYSLWSHGFRANSWGNWRLRSVIRGWDL